MNMKSANPRVSIILPNYNCRDFLGACFASVRAQGIEHYELIVIDDGSTDDSWAYLQEVASADPCLQIIRAERIGVSAARNLGVASARAEFIAFIDADDIWYANKLSAQLDFMKASGAALSFTDYDHVKEGKSESISGCFEFWPLFNRIAQAQGGDDYAVLANPLATLLAENVVGTSTAVVRRDTFLAVGGFDTQLSSASDWDLWLKLAAAGGVGYSRARMTAYLIREGSISRNQGKRLLAMEGIIGRHACLLSEVHSPAIAHAYARLALGYQEFYTSEGQHGRALVCALRALVRLPTWRNTRAFLACVRNLLLPWTRQTPALSSGG